MASKFKCAEIFAGAGLLGAAFKDFGAKPVFAGEADSRAVASFNRNVAPVAQVWDVRAVKPGLRCDLVLAGPPCQGFSTLGRCDPTDARNKLSLAVIDWTLLTGARVLVIENVPRFLESAYWRRIKRKLAEHGYASAEWILEAQTFGAAQRRTRAFGILSKLGIPALPEATIVGTAQTVREAFRGLTIAPDSAGMHIAPVPSNIALARFKHIPPNGDKRDVMRRAPHLCPPSWRKMGAQATDVWGRLDYDGPANTLRCSFQNASKGRYVHPVADRVITLREGARLQGVPDSWEFSGDRTSIARQIGNGVPLPLGRAVAKAIGAIFA